MEQPAHFFLGQNEFEGVQIYDVIQNNKLDYWFATDHGFYKYDGYSFEQIVCAEMNGQSAFGFVKNGNGTIFCYNLNNQIIKIEDDNCTVFYELKENERASDIFLSTTNENNLLVVTRSILIFDEAGNKTRLNNIPTSYYSFPFSTNTGAILSHLSDLDSVLLITSDKAEIKALNNHGEPVEGILKFFCLGSDTFAISGVNKKIYSFNLAGFDLSPLKVNPLQDSKEFLRFYNENDQLWIAATVNGVSVLSGGNQPVLSDKFFSNYLISDVYQDAEGNLLLCTFNQGIIVIPDIRIPDVLPVSSKHSIVSIHYDNSFGILMGTLTGQLLTYRDNEFILLSDEGSRPLQAVFSWPGFPYIIFDDGFIKAYHKSTGKILSLHKGSLKDATLVSQNTIYMALNVGVCSVVFSESGFEVAYKENLTMRSYAITSEPLTGNINIATSEGLKTILPDGTIDTITFQNELIFANDLAMHGNQLLIATKKNGILISNNGFIDQAIIPELTQKESEIYKIKLHDDKIFANTSEGFVVMDMSGKILIHLNKVHGFATNKIFDFDVVDDKIWIAHSKGVQSLDTTMLRIVIQKPLIRISSVLINDEKYDDESYDENNNHRLFTHDQRKFLFTVSSPTLRNRESIRYHYRLLGYEQDWNINDYENNSIIYNALAPDDYTFMVKAENQSVFSETISYKFSISKPYYLTWWFISLFIVVVILVIYLIYKWQLKKQRKKAQLINEINLSKLTAIQSQMNPHFIFNSLNSIQDMVLKGDIDNSYTSITKFSDLIRRTLNYSDKDFIDFEQEIKLIELYLSLEKLRFKTELQVKVDIGNVEDIQIPPMLIQPFIENALIHGLLHKAGQKNLSIRFHLNDVLICTIEDNGIGRKKSQEIKERQRVSHESFSGDAIQKRFQILSQHFKGELGFRYEDIVQNNEITGTRAIIHIPFRRKF